MKTKTSRPFRSSTASLMAVGILTSTADAAILLTFSESGNDVIITLSGATLLPPVVTVGSNGPVNRFSSSNFDYIPTAQFHYAGLGNPQGKPIVSGTFDSSSTATVFSYNDRAVAFDATLSGGDTWAPTGNLVIKNHNFLSLYGSATPALGPSGYWPNGTLAFSSVFAVPEPSGVILMGIGLTSFLWTRRRE